MEDYPHEFTFTTEDKYNKLKGNYAYKSFYYFYKNGSRLCKKRVLPV